MERDYMIAGLRVRMDTFGRTEQQAEKYLTQTTGEPDIVISNHPEAFLQRHPHLTLEECEYLTSGSSFYRQLVNFDGMMLHASAVVKDGYAYLFSAPCGTGKSTHTGLWRKTFGEDQVLMLNDDKPALRLIDGVWYAYGTPWCGKDGINRNVKAPLKGICFLRRGESNSMRRLSTIEAIGAIFSQTQSRFANSEALGGLTTVIEQLIRDIPVYELVNTADEEAALLSHKIMSTEE